MAENRVSNSSKNQACSRIRTRTAPSSKIIFSFTAKTKPSLIPDHLENRLDEYFKFISHEIAYWMSMHEKHLFNMAEPADHLIPVAIRTPTIFKITKDFVVLLSS